MGELEAMAHGQALDGVSILTDVPARRGLRLGNQYGQRKGKGKGREV